MEEKKSRKSGKKMGILLILLFIAPFSVAAVNSLTGHSFMQIGLSHYILWILIALLWIVILVVFFWLVSRQKVRQETISDSDQRKHNIAMVVIIAMGYFPMRIIVRSCLDIPYLSDPAVVELHDIDLVSDTPDGSYIYTIDGVDEENRKYRFNIGRKYYSELIDAGHGNAVVEISYLPHTDNVMSVRITTEEA
jgi:hypothetical protein